NGIGEGGLGFVIPGSSAGGNRLRARQMVSQERDQGKQAQDGRTGAQDSVGRPLALALKAQVSADFLESDLNAPSGNDPSKNLQWTGSLVSSKEGDRWEFAQTVAHKNPAHGQRVATRAVPQRAARGYLDDPLTCAVPGHLVRFPLRSGIT